jgi:hypothetical protein
MLKKTILSIGVILLSIWLIQSCGTKVTNYGDKTSKELTYPEQFKEKIKDIKKLNLPFKTDSTYFKEFALKEEMDDATVKLLVSNFSGSEDYNDNYVYEVLRLNHLKRMAQYEDYVNLLDLGQLKDANAYWIGRIEKGDTALILWNVQYSSYEACPFYSGNEIFVSVIHEGIVKKCIKIGEYSTGGDAPYWFENFILFSIDDSFMIERKKYYASYDDDALVESIISSDSISLK